MQPPAAVAEEHAAATALPTVEVPLSQADTMAAERAANVHGEAAALADDEEEALAAETAAPTDAQADSQASAVEQAAGLQPRPEAADALADETTAAAPTIVEIQPVAQSCSRGATTSCYSGGAGSSRCSRCRGADSSTSS